MGVLSGEEPRRWYLGRVLKFLKIHFVTRHTRLPSLKRMVVCKVKEKTISRNLGFFVFFKESEEERRVLLVCVRDYEKEHGSEGVFDMVVVTNTPTSNVSFKNCKLLWDLKVSFCFFCVKGKMKVLMIME